MYMEILRKNFRKKLNKIFLLLYAKLTYCYGDYSYYPQVFLKTLARAVLEKNNDYYVKWQLIFFLKKIITKYRTYCY